MMRNKMRKLAEEGRREREVADGEVVRADWAVAGRRETGRRGETYRLEG